MRAFLGLLRRFQSDERGAFIAIFGILAIVLIATAGAVVDYTSVEQARTRAQVALDAAALALQPRIYTSDTNDQIKTKAQALLTDRIADTRITATVQNVTRDTTKGEIYMTARVTVPLSFVALIGINQMSAALQSKATRGSTNLEVGVALDITLSMQGQKIQDLKDAADDLIDAVVQDVQTPTYTKMAIIPYSNSVNVGSTYAASARGPVTDYTGIIGASWMVSGSNKTVSAITKASSARITTSVAHGYSTGDVVYFTGIAYTGNTSGTQFTSLNTSGGTTRAYTITVTSTTQFTLNGVNSSNWKNTYTANSGTVRKCQTSACEVVITSTSHGIATNDNVYITNLGGTSAGGVGVSSITALNNTVYTATRLTADTFALDNTDGPDYSNSSGNSTYSSGGRSYCVKQGCYYYYFRGDDNAYHMFSITNCVTERVGANQYTDAAPSTTYVGRQYPKNASDCPTPAMQPLTDNKTTLHNLVGTLSAGGSTAGQIGLGWAWYTVSPNFASMFPTISKPAAYGTANLVKVVVLMTDGAFNTAYCNGVFSQNYNGLAGSSERENCNATNGSPFTQAESICTGIKKGGDGILNTADDIVLYTVLFDLDDDQTAIDFMAGCATDANHAYVATDGDDLSDAFNEIGQNITALRIAQ